MRSEDGFRHRAGLEQAETEQNGVAHNAPNGVDGIPGNRYRLYQHGVNRHADEDEKALKTQCKQAFQVVLPHVRLLVVAPCCHGDGRKAYHAVNLDHAPVHDDKNDDAQDPHGDADEETLQEQPEQGSYVHLHQARLQHGRVKIRNFHDCGKCDIIQLSGSNETVGKERVPMKGATSIQERLWELRKDKGLNLEELSELTGISKSALGSYEKEDYKEINHGNLITLADFYGVSVDYLLCRTENREQINTSLTELHLNDEMVALLKSGRINNRLLCELATHKDFIKFLADIEIYVDGIATMQIQNLNALVDTVRHEIIERYRPGEDDPHLKVLQAAHISDDEYFSHMVRDDLNLIIRDIREAHKKDSESAPQTTVADELKENLEAVENFKGSRDEKLVVLYCKQLGINYKNLSDEEFRWLIRILKKSKKMGTPISQRKKR